MSSGKKLSVVALIAGLGLGGLVSIPKARHLSLDQFKQQRLEQAELTQKEMASILLPEQVPVKTQHKVERPEYPARPEPVTVPAGSGFKNAGRITSAWFVDYSPNADHTAWDPIYLYAWKPDPESHLNAVLSLKDLTTGTNRVWESPTDIGDITVTDITGLHGVVKFISSAGKTGTFNLQTATWLIEQ